MLDRMRPLVLIVLAGCGGAVAAPDAAPALDAGPDAAPAPPITLGATRGAVDDGFDVAIDGTAGVRVGAIALAADTGTLGIDGTTAAFVYQRQPFGALTLYQGFAVGPERWDVFWAYCQGPALTGAYAEGVGAPTLFYEAATGACADAGAPITAPVTLPALSIPSPAPLAGYTVDGPALTVHHDGTGSITLAGVKLPLIVFGDVDCSQCAASGWHELHTLVRDDANARAIFVILYLQDAAPGAVLLAYARALPDLTDPIGTVNLAATWTLPPAARVRVAPGAPPPGMPPPTLAAP
jgi:hypothetical protein